MRNDFNLSSIIRSPADGHTISRLGLALKQFFVASDEVVFASFSDRSFGQGRRTCPAQTSTILQPRGARCKSLATDESKYKYLPQMNTDGTQINSEDEETKLMSTTSSILHLHFICVYLCSSVGRISAFQNCPEVTILSANCRGGGGWQRGMNKLGYSFPRALLLTPNHFPFFESRFLLRMGIPSAGLGWR